MATQNASLQPIYDRLHGATGYHPMSAETFADWSLEAGDIISVSRDGTAYSSPVHNSKLVWRGTPQMTINSTGKEERDAVSKISKRKYGRGRSGMWNDQRIHYDLYSEDGRLKSQLDLTASHLQLEFQTDITSTVALFRSELEMTSSHLTLEFQTGITSTVTLLENELEITAGHLETSFTNNITSLRGELELTASHLQTEFIDNINSVRSELVLTASHLQTEFEDNINSVRSELVLTASHLRTEFEDGISSVRSELVLTASHLQTEFEDGISSVHSEVVQTASSWNARVAGVVDEQGNVTAASIALAINASSGQSEAKINANRVYIGNEASTTVIAGKISLSDVTANYINSKIADIPAIYAQAIYSSALYFKNPNDTTQYLSASGYLRGIREINLTQNGNNTYTLSYKNYTDNSQSEWRTIGTFSRATALDGAWNSGTLTVTASPQEETFSRSLTQKLDLATWDAGSVTVPVHATYGPQGQYEQDTYWSVYVPFSDRLEDKGTITSDGVYTPGPGYIGISRINVQVSGTVRPIDAARTRFNSATGGYFIEAYDSGASGAPSITGSSTSYTLAVTGSGSSAKVQIQDGNGNRISNTHELSVAGVYADGQNSVDVTVGTWTTSNDTYSEIASARRATATFSPSAGTGGKADVEISFLANQSSTNPERVQMGIGYRDDITATFAQIAGRWFELQEGAWSNNRKSVNFVTKVTNPNRTYATLEVDASGIYNSGWAAAYAKVSLPGSNTSTSSCTVKTPGATPSSNPVQNSDVFSLSVANNTADILRAQNSGTAITVARITHNKYNAGREAVTLLDPSADTRQTLNATRTFTVSTTGRTNASGTTANLSKDVPLHLYAGNWSGNTCTVYLKWGATTGSSGTDYAKISVDASTLVTNAGYAGRAAVTLSNPVWNDITGDLPSSRTVTVSTSGRTNSSGTTDNLSKSVALYLTQGRWSSNKLIVSMRATSTSGTAYAQTTVDASTLVTNAGYAGRAAVTISDTLSWTTAPAEGITVSQNTVTVSTSGRTNSSGTASEVTKAIYLYSNATTSGLTATFYVTHTSSSSANRIIKRTATCSDGNLTAGNIKEGVTIFGVTGTYSGGSSIVPRTAISVNDPVWYNSGDSLPSVDATLNTMGSIINSHKNSRGYVYFNVTIAGVSGNKKYRIPIG